MSALLNKPLDFGRRFAKIYISQRLSQAAAALSYYFTMTLFPLLIVLYTLLGNSYEKAMRAVSLAEKLMAADTANSIREFLAYIAVHNSGAMMIAGITMLATTASAAVRSLSATIGNMQGGARFYGIKSFPFSIIFSLAFTIAIYVSMLIMLTGREFIRGLNSLLPFVDISHSWNYLRFIVLAGIVFVLFWIAYAFSKRKTDTYNTFPGAFFATLGMVAVSIGFSVFLSASQRYPLIYGSIASLILLMFWLYVSSLVVYCGAALNIVLRDMKADAASKKDS